MNDAAPESTARRYGMVFDEIATEYDRRRPAYPDELIDQACHVAGIGAVFSASAFHWVDPEVSWRKAADVLVPGGTLALVQYCGLEDPCSKLDQEAALAAMRKVAPDIDADWPAYRDLDATLAGMEQRRGNVSEVWAWFGSYDIGRDYAGRLFGDVQVAVMPKLSEHTSDELSALVRTMSFHARLSLSQRQALEREHQAIYERLGRPIRASIVAALVTARRSAEGDDHRTSPQGTPY
jgi:hypothetical protein